MVLTTPLLVSRLAGFLRWTAADESFADDLERIYVDTLSDRLGRTLARLRVVDRRAADEMPARIRALPHDAFFRLLTAPRTCFHLSYADARELPATLSYLDQALAFEEQRLGGAPARGAWSYLGDVYAAGPSEPQRDWRAPTVLTTVPIDYASPFAQGSLPEVPGESIPFEPDELARTLTHTESAATGIARVPRTADCMRRFVRAIVIRKDPTTPTRFASASSQLTMGMVVLRNPQLPVATPTEIADGLVHEMIHNLADIVELREPFIRDPETARQVRINSPWTGRSLDLNTYIQACFVWYGLWEFWLGAFGTQVFEERAAAACLQAPSAGLIRGMVEPLEPVASALTAGLYESLAAAQSRVQAGLAAVGVA